MRYLVAAALVILVGAAWVLAEDKTMKVEVRTEDGQEISITVNGVTEIVTLDDLDEGEQRSFDVNGHEVTVKRVGDQLSLVHEGIFAGHLQGGHHKEVWVEAGEGDAGAKHVVIMKHGPDGTISVDTDTELMFIGEEDFSSQDVLILKGAVGEIDIEALKEKYGQDFEEFHTAHGAHVLKWVAEGDADHPIIIKRMGHHGGGEYVTYRCEETGSMLTVKADEKLLDDYIDPVTGCVMKKVEHTGVHVIKILKEKEIGSEDE
jgi:hypothetical protein